MLGRSQVGKISIEGLILNIAYKDFIYPQKIKPMSLNPIILYY